MDLMLLRIKISRWDVFFLFLEGLDILYCIFNTCVFGAGSRIKSEEIGFAVCTTGIFQLFSVPFTSG